jgi:hypothetical protein
VKNHVHHILEKLRVGRRVEAVLAAPTAVSWTGPSPSIIGSGPFPGSQLYPRVYSQRGSREGHCRESTEGPALIVLFDMSVVVRAEGRGCVHFPSLTATLFPSLTTTLIVSRGVEMRGQPRVNPTPRESLPYYAATLQETARCPG